MDGGEKKGSQREEDNMKYDSNMSINFYRSPPPPHLSLFFLQPKEIECLFYSRI